jgi:hypothetical protein
MNYLKQLLIKPLHQQVLRLWHWIKEQTVENKEESFLYTEEQLMARLKFFIGICLALTLVGIVFVVLYSLIFVTQPLNAMAPIDQKFFELIIPIATFLTGTLSGIMLAGNDKDLKAQAIGAATRPSGPSPMPPTGGGSSPSTPPKPMMPTPTVSTTPVTAPKEDLLKGLDAYMDDEAPKTPPVPKVSVPSIKKPGE